MSFHPDEKWKPGGPENMARLLRSVVRGAQIINSQWEFEENGQTFRGKKCGVCHRIYTRATWKELPLLVTPQFPEGQKRDEYETQEFRNCLCGSTLTTIVAVHRLDEDC